MAAKWADYLISAVRYNAADTHIDQVRCHADNGDSVGLASQKARADVVQMLAAGTTFATIYKDSSDTSKWKYGAEVRVVTIDGTRFIRTDADNTKADDLGSLPRF